MANKITDILFQLVKSLEKAEKRHFKIYIRRNSSNGDLKIVQLFDALDKLKDYDEKLLLSKLDNIQKPQLANLKAHLYKQILASLRLLKSADSIDLQLNEQFDYAHILYKKGLFHQSLRILDRAKEMARTNQKFNFLIQVISLEKRIESLHITRSIQHRADALAEEAREVSDHISTVAQLSNLSLQLYSWYIKYGHARNEKDLASLRQFMIESTPLNSFSRTGFYERLHLYQAYSWYAFIRQDFIQYYRYAQKWVELFNEQPLMIRVETGHYIKGLHNLLNAHFDLRNHEGFDKVLAIMEELSQTDRVKDHDNFRIQVFVYLEIARMNKHFMRGTFREGLSQVPIIENGLKEYHIWLDRHRILVMNYKIAMLYFGSGDYEKAIDYLQKIINEPVDLRLDLQCYARLMHLMAHYELGNEMLMESLIKSVYRFMARMENLTTIEQNIFRFLKQSIHVPVRRLSEELKELLAKIKHLEGDRFETRSFAYMDIISWIESKVYQKSMSQVIHEKYLSSPRRSAKKQRNVRSLPEAATA